MGCWMFKSTQQCMSSQFLTCCSRVAICSSRAHALSLAFLTSNAICWEGGRERGKEEGREGGREGGRGGREGGREGGGGGGGGEGGKESGRERRVKKRREEHFNCYVNTQNLEQWTVQRRREMGHPEVEIRITCWAVKCPSTLDFDWTFTKYVRSCPRLSPKRNHKSMNVCSPS